jgi:nucleoside-diphosphate-sugar epimerase
VHSRAGGEVFNIGNPQEITILDLAHRVKELAGSTSRIVHRALPPDDPKRRCPDISEAKKPLGWSPTVTLEEGLNKTIEWFMQRRQAVA